MVTLKLLYKDCQRSLVTKWRKTDQWVQQRAKGVGSLRLAYSRVHLNTARKRMLERKNSVDVLSVLACPGTALATDAVF